ncbi:hypothetical protein K491DRAFT_463967 [Lophiostoma macrostomum CBS 122681]|uniref:Uncharacterized protein n=1 Tax=Lophiostoma macrostomum CBS 122681 TaxID=1314788 RepID=A0A6A6T6Z0_9PLEO|nr:hypothetical protein K491DRAFT_463967 [Lophiostoma macrostomum CBS 122681]
MTSLPNDDSSCALTFTCSFALVITIHGSKFACLSQHSSRSEYCYFDDITLHFTMCSTTQNIKQPSAEVIEALCHFCKSSTCRNLRYPSDSYNLTSARAHFLSGLRILR